ncbi:MAG: bifunctional transaldolase/phosoglucose isomerase [Bacteroidetes bacterium]|jgi:transaldolase/glucose-6-phosphate isomerase|nr:bifunctional transaldolase/phosoglucose isomerase [Bacteroidota bacterium]
MNPLQQLHERDQSFWLDYIRRDLIASGELQRLIDEDGLRGMTSNPAIFEKAIAGTDEYDDLLHELLRENPYLSPDELYEELAFDEIRNACDVLRPVYDASDNGDGCVSLEVSPSLAHDTTGTIEEARRLWDAVGRPNVMIKVPATPEGIPAIETLIGEGINVNVTLMFSMDHYEAVAHAYLRGLEHALEHDLDVSKIYSVASFFVSRVDTKIDGLLDEIGTPEAKSLKGTIAIANAKVTYQRFQELFLGEAFDPLREHGATVQRVLWASTSTKNPDYSDIRYVTHLIGPHTVNTMPPRTADAFRDHGEVSSDTVTEDVEQARRHLALLAELGIDLNQATEELQAEGVEKFQTPFSSLIDTLDSERDRILADLADQMTLSLGEHAEAVDAQLDAWQEANFAKRLWLKDPTLWSDEPVDELSDRLGWLDLPESMLMPARELKTYAAAQKQRFDYVVVLGMGGSSLAPDVYRQTFGHAEDYPALLMLDSTHPQAVRDIEDQVDLARTLFVVASKSGSTAETMSFFRYFYDRVSQVSGTPGQHFVAVTDPGSKLEHIAHDRDFLRLFPAPPEVGGRYSALTVFGLVPGALTGVDVSKLLDRAWLLSQQTTGRTDVHDNSPLRLGAAMAALADAGRDKVTFVTSPSLDAFPLWLEQLIAESLGKDGEGVVPIADEALSDDVDAYGDDRFFVYFHVEGDEDTEQQAALDALEDAGHPVARITLHDPFDLGRELFRWEMAVAAAGAAMDVHPFNQPNVELAKTLARESMQQASSNGASTVDEITADDADLADALGDWLDAAQEGDYLAFHAYIPPSDATTETLQQLRHACLHQTDVATTLGYGPRFLHSTGQLHKGGPNTIHVLQLVDDITDDLPVPETDYTFGQLIRAQTVGDYQALRQEDRHVLRVNLGDDVAAGLQRLLDTLQTTV